jgi:hypothetical protein
MPPNNVEPGGYLLTRAVSCSFNVKETELLFQTFNKAVSAKVYTGLTPLIIKV